MFLKLNHQKMEIYLISRMIVRACHKLTKTFPADERFIMVPQIRRAALSLHLNIAEGASKKSAAERKRYYGIARSSLVEIDGALDLAADLEYFRNDSIPELESLVVKAFKMLTKMIE